MTQERPPFNLDEICWPTKVTPDDLEGIAIYRKKGGDSVAVSVSRVMLEEADYLLPPYNSKTLIEVLPRLGDEIRLLVVYSELPKTILDIEEYIRSGIPPAAEENIPKKLKKLLNLARAIIPTIDQATVLITNEANFYATLPGLVQAFQKSENPLEFALGFSDLGIKTFQEPPASEVALVAITQASTRFHQLYAAAQEAGLG